MILTVSLTGLLGKRKPRPKGLAAYEMGKPLGSGGFGSVYAARRKRDNLPVGKEKHLIPHIIFRVVLYGGIFCKHRDSSKDGALISRHLKAISITRNYKLLQNYSKILCKLCIRKNNYCRMSLHLLRSNQ